MRVKLHEDHLRSLMFGLQDGIVSTTGVVAGISAGVESKEIVVLAAIVAVSVEASSMAAGQYTSEKAVHQMNKDTKHNDSLILGALIMFVSYVIGGSFSIIPTIIFDQPLGRYLAIASSFVGLWLIGYIKGRFVGSAPLRSAIELFVIGGLATLIGLIIGVTLRIN